jgi:hypothetical protein
MSCNHLAPTTPASVTVTFAISGQEPVHGVAGVNPNYDPDDGEALAIQEALDNAKAEMERRFFARRGFAPPPLGSAVDVAGMSMTVNKIDYGAMEVVLRFAAPVVAPILARGKVA